ncbi:hypothetical protein IBA8401_02160 [Pseudomonas syringae]|nr:hypothetical protein PSYRMG_05015 [Pseudomonas syringae UMAF0158]KPB30241.1 Uncharacterized protein AC517_0399 [Pseudomonas syringae pv. syringae]
MVTLSSDLQRGTLILPFMGTFKGQVAAVQKRVAAVRLAALQAG